MGIEVESKICPKCGKGYLVFNGIAHETEIDAQENLTITQVITYNCGMCDAWFYKKEKRHKATKLKDSK